MTQCCGAAEWVLQQHCNTMLCLQQHCNTMLRLQQHCNTMLRLQQHCNTVLRREWVMQQQTTQRNQGCCGHRNTKMCHVTDHVTDMDHVTETRMSEEGGGREGGGCGRRERDLSGDGEDDEEGQVGGLMVDQQQQPVHLPPQMMKRAR